MTMNSWTIAAGAVLALSALAAACSNEQSDTANGAAAADQSQTATITPAARQEAQQIFATRCAACHGAEGRGDGPGAAGLTPKPRNYHDSTWQASVTDEEIENAIVYGGAAVGRSPAMVGNPDLASKPAVVAALRETIREFGKQQ